MLKEKLLFIASQFFNNGFLYSFGSNANGATGLNTAVGNTLVPTRVGTDSIWFLTNASDSFSLAIQTDGSLWSWGSNGFGATGQNTDTGIILVPTQTGVATNWSKISAGDSFSLAVKSDGTLWSWGNNLLGRTGLGLSSGNTLIPTQVGVDTNWLDVNAGNAYAIAIKTDGTLWSWGSNSSGLTGQNTTVGNILTPTQIGVDTDWQSIGKTILSPAIAIKTNGTLWVWGSNGSGATGLNTTAGNTLVPTQVGADTDWAKAAGGGVYGAAIKTNGTLWSWGLGNAFRTGQNTAANILVPTQIGVDTDWNLLALGNNHGIALKTNNTAWSWGSNQNGKTGQGIDTGETQVPTQIGTDTNWISGSARLNFSLLIKRP